MKRGQINCLRLFLLVIACTGLLNAGEFESFFNEPVAPAKTQQTPSKQAQSEESKQPSAPETDDFAFLTEAPLEEPTPSKEEEEEAGSVKLNFPLLGKLKLSPYTDTTKQPEEEGVKIKFADASKKLQLGAMVIDDGEITIVDNKVGMTGRATFFENKKARFGLRSIEWDPQTKIVSKAILGVEFLPDKSGKKPKLEVIPGYSIALEKADIEIERGQPLSFVTTTTLFGLQVRIAFTFTRADVNAYIELPADQPLATLIPDVSKLPSLSTGVIKRARIQINNVWNKDKTQPLHAVATGILKIPPEALVQNVVGPATEKTEAKPVQPAVKTKQTEEEEIILEGFADVLSSTIEEAKQPEQLQNQPAKPLDSNAFSMEVVLAKVGVQGSLTADQFPLPGIGIIKKATISINTITKPKHVSLSGDMDFNVSDVGDLQIKVESSISPKGVAFAGKILKPFTYAGITLKDLHASFDTANKAMDLTGAVFLPMASDLALDASILLLPDPADPQNPSKRIINFRTKTASKEFRPFTNIEPAELRSVLETFYIKDFDAGVEVTSMAGKLTKSIYLKGDFYFLGVKISSVVRFVQNDKGEKGIYIKAPMGTDKKLSDILPGLKGPVFDNLVFEQAAFTACSIEYVDVTIDPVTNAKESIDVKKGLSFIAQVPLKGTLEPVGKFMGSTDQTFRMYGNLDVNNIRASEFGFLLAKGFPQPEKAVSMGDTLIAISGKPSFEVRTTIFFRPSKEEKLKFTGKFDFKVDKVALDTSLEGTWNSPFGLPKSSMSDVALIVGMAYGSPGLPTQLGGGGKLKLGDFLADVYFSADAAIKDIALKGCIPEPMNMSGIALKVLKSAFDIDIGPFKVPDPEVRNLTFEFAPQDVVVGTELIKQGIVFKGDFPFLGSTAYVDIMLQPSLGGGLKIFGAIEPLSIANGLIKITKSAQEYGGRCFIPPKPKPCVLPSTSEVEELKKAGEEFAEQAKATILQRCKPGVKPPTPPKDLDLDEIEEGVLPMQGVDVSNMPRVDIELTLKRQNFLISGALNLADLFSADACMSIDRSGMHFMFETGLKKANEVIMWDGKPLFLARIIAHSSGDLLDPQFTLNIDFIQYLQQYIKQKADEGLKKAQEAVVDALNSAQADLNKIKDAMAESDKKLEDARAQLESARRSLTAITDAKAEARGALDKAKRDVASLQNEIDSLKRWYYSLPKA